jgi:LPLT family lysophospholipid transporter-like MFS transporter
MYPKRNYVLLLISQFLGALGDNVFLWLIIGPLTLQQKQGLVTEQQLSVANAIYACIFYAPYVLFAPLAGFLNDRFAKTRWLVGGNLFKCTGTVLAALSLTGGHYWQGVGYFLVGMGACVFSPAKYGVLPEILPEHRLVKANGTVEMLTILAILMGIVLGAWVVDHFPLVTGYLVVLGIYGSSFVLSLLMQQTPFDAQVKLSASLREFKIHVRALFCSARLGKVLIGTGLFWATGAVLKINFQSWGLDELKLKDNTAISLLSLWLAVGVIAGSVLAGQLHKVGDLRGTSRYGWLMAGCIALMGMIKFGTPHYLVVAILILAGTFAGLFLIPLNAGLQSESDHTKLGKTIAVQNLVDNLAMIIGGAGVSLAAHFGSTAPVNFLFLAALAATVVTFLRMPQVHAKPLPSAREKKT